MVNSLLLALYWWLLLFSLGLIFFPIAQVFFKKFFDKGYLFAKIVALTLLSWPIFLLSHLKLVPFTQAGIWAALILAIIINIFVIKKKVLINKKLAGRIILEEVFFLIALLFWSYIRSLKPDISGLEKFMDFGFVKSLVNSRYLPPADMWFAGETINYYYYGHFITAFLTKLSGLSPTITYNLMIATLFALTTTQVFSLTANLMAKISKKTKSIIATGLLGALIIGFASNFHTPYHLLKDGPEKYWYPDATRFIGYNPPTNDKTIHEFPAYSFIVADLHGHVLSLPLVLLFIALTWSLIEEANHRKHWFKAMFLGFILGIIYMTNSWDFPIYLLFLGVNLLIRQLIDLRKPLTISSVTKTLTKIIPIIMIVIGLSVLVSLPFNLNFKQIAQGVGLVTTRTPISQLFILWGAFGFWATSFTISFKLLSSKKPVDYFILGLITTAFILIALPEILYVKDIYSTDFYRANTMFKFTFQAYLMLTIAAGYIIGRIGQTLKLFIAKIFFLLTSSLIITSLLVYPLFSVPGFYNSINPKNFQGLEGSSFLAGKYPEDYQAIIWIEKNLPESVVILEAAGDSYTDYGRVSAFTGRPTVQGWIVHQWLWRGNYELPAKRASCVEQIYQSANITTAQKLLKEYSVDYIFFGTLEQKKYPQANLEKLNFLGKPVFRAGKTVIFEVEK